MAFLENRTHMFFLFYLSIINQYFFFFFDKPVGFCLQIQTLTLIVSRQLPDIMCVKIANSANLNIHLQIFQVSKIQNRSLRFRSTHSGVLQPSYIPVTPGRWVQFPGNITSERFLLFFRVWYCPVDAEKPEHWRPRYSNIWDHINLWNTDFYPEITLAHSRVSTDREESCQISSYRPFTAVNSLGSWQIVQTVCRYSITRW